MTAWYLTLFIVFSINILFKSSRINQRKTAVVLTFIVLFLFQALRDESVGIDLINYQKFYKVFYHQSYLEIISKGEQFSLEPVFIIFCKIIADITNGNWQIFIAIIAFFNNYVLCKMIYKYGRNTLYAFSIYIAIGLFVFSFSGIRQMIAISLCMLAFDKLNSGKKIMACIYIIFAFLFHNSAIIFIAAMFMNKIRIKPISLLWITAVFLVFTFWGRSVFRIAVEVVLPSFKGYLNEENGKIGLFGFFLLLSLYLLCYLNYDKKNKAFHNSNLIYLTTLAVICQSFGNLSTLTMRITLYFLPYLALGIANSDKLTKSYSQNVNEKGLMLKFNTEKDKTTILILNVMVCFYIIFIVYTILIQDLNSGYLNVVPYKLFWEKL